jgi:hypothetical protein
VSSIRTDMVKQAEWAIAHEPEIHYKELRPIPLDAFKAHKLPLTTDCSGMVTSIAYAAGVKPDPNGQSYNGQGYTGTLLAHCPHITRAQALPGDFVVFGPYPGEHVVMLLEAGSAADPYVMSHGTEAGPRKERLSVEVAYFHSTVTYLRSVVTPSTSHVWDVRDGRGEHLATTKHPVRWAIRHPRSFRKHGLVSFHRRSVSP